MEAALEGLAGVENVRVDLKSDRFTVGYDPDEVSPAEMLSAIEDLDFEPEIATSVDVATAREELGPIPSPVAEALAAAKSANRFLFLDFWAEWCAPCKVLEERTIPDARIQSFLAKHEFLRVDADAYPEAVQHFDALGLPTVLVLSPLGDELYRHVGFVDANQLAAELAALPPP